AVWDYLRNHLGDQIRRLIEIAKYVYPANSVTHAVGDINPNIGFFEYMGLLAEAAALNRQIADAWARYHQLQQAGGLAGDLAVLSPPAAFAEAGIALAQGDYCTAGVALAAVLIPGRGRLNLGSWSSWFGRSCFSAGTPLLTPSGSKLIENFVAGDLVLSRDE